MSPFTLGDELAKIEPEFHDLNKAHLRRSQSAAQTQVESHAASTLSESTGPEDKPLLPSDLIMTPTENNLNHYN